METPQATGKNLIVEIIEKEPEKGVLIIPVSNPEQRECRVISVGSSCLDSNDVRSGNIIVIPYYGGTKLKHNGKEYLVIGLDNILAIVG